MCVYDIAICSLTSCRELFIEQPKSNWASLAPSSCWPVVKVDPRCQCGIMRRAIWRKLPPISLVLISRQRQDIGERVQGEAWHDLEWLRIDHGHCPLYGRFIQEVGKTLGLRHDTMATAAVYFHRFWFFQRCLLNICFLSDSTWNIVSRSFHDM